MICFERYARVLVNPLNFAFAFLILIVQAASANNESLDRIDAYRENLRSIILASDQSQIELSRGFRVRFRVYRNGFIGVPEVLSLSQDPQSDRGYLRKILSSIEAGLKSPLDGPAQVVVSFNKDVSISVENANLDSKTIKSVEQLKSAYLKSHVRNPKSRSEISKQWESTFKLLEALGRCPDDRELEKLAISALSHIGLDPSSSEQMFLAARYTAGDTSLFFESKYLSSSLLQSVAFQEITWSRHSEVDVDQLLHSYTRYIAAGELKELSKNPVFRETIIDRGKLFEFADQLNLAKDSYEKACSEGVYKESFLPQKLKTRLSQARDLTATIANIAPENLIPTGSKFSDLEKLICWLPTDTEVLYAARGPFVSVDIESSLPEDFRSSVLPRAAFDRPFRHAKSFFWGKQIKVGIRAGKNYRNPTGLGGSPGDEYTITVFSDEDKLAAQRAWELIAKDAQRYSLWKGVQILEYHFEAEDDASRLYVCVPTEGILLTATRKSDIEEILTRLASKQSKRALSRALPEWKYLDRDSKFFALRHYNPLTSMLDPTSPELTMTRSGYLGKVDAVGVLFQHSMQSNSGRATYLTSCRAFQDQMIKLWGASISPNKGDGAITNSKVVAGKRLEMSLKIDKQTAGGVFFVMSYAFGSMICT